MFKVMTCNIRVSSAPDTVYSWANRRAVCAEIIRRHAPDLIGFQEMRQDQHDDLFSALGNYDSFGVIDEPGGHPVDQIFFRRDRYELLTGHSYWLSATPDRCGSKSWDSNCIRMANAALLRDRQTGRKLRFTNTHLDHISQPAREEQAGVINADCQAQPADLPQILTGDMNCDFVNPAIQRFLQNGWIDTYAAIHQVNEPGFTYHNFIGPRYNIPHYGKMDFVFCRGQLLPRTATIVKDSIDGRFPSDHYFVAAEFDFVPVAAKVRNCSPEALAVTY